MSTLILNKQTNKTLHSYINRCQLDNEVRNRLVFSFYNFQTFLHSWSFDWIRVGNWHSALFTSIPSAWNSPWYPAHFKNNLMNVYEGPSYFSFLPLSLADPEGGLGAELPHHEPSEIYSESILIWNQSVVSCPSVTVTSWPTYRFFKRQVRWSGTPISLRIFHSELWATQSNALA